ncbi:MAG: outer membrane beta-barrel protein [Pseudomonadota bacterium]
MNNSMSNILVATIGAMALTFGPAFAGNVNEITPEPGLNAPVAPGDWAGIYAGAFVGGGTYAGTAQDMGGNALDNDGQMVRLDDFAGEAGVVVGYNVQRGSLVYGAELDYAAISFDTEEIYDLDFRQQAGLSSLMSLRGRVGVAIDQTLIYGTVGYGFASVQACISDDEDAICDPDDNRTAVLDEMLSGLVFGLGLEHRLSDALSVRLDYLQFESAWSDDISYNDNVDQELARFSADAKAIRIGVNYNF